MAFTDNNSCSLVILVRLARLVVLVVLVRLVRLVGLVIIVFFHAYSILLFQIQTPFREIILERLFQRLLQAKGAMAKLIPTGNENSFKRFYDNLFNVIM